jgi:hypothetical protein
VPRSLVMLSERPRGPRCSLAGGGRAGAPRLRDYSRTLRDQTIIRVLSRRERIAAIRADLRARLDAGEFGDQLYVCALGHEWLLWAHLVVLLGMAAYMETWEPERKAHPRYLETARYVAGELERISAVVLDRGDRKRPE